MRVGVFAYNFKHWKTQAGLQNLVLAGRRPEVIFAADPVKLGFYRSKIRTGPKDLFLLHPKEVADFYDIDYCVVKHNSRETAELIKDYDLDLGVVLGARILKPEAFTHFKKGVLNMHPGILPENRGLDTIKWAIERSLPQGVTTHIIDKNIDRGHLVEMERINVYEDDTLLDLKIRIQNLEQKLMISSINLLESVKIQELQKISKGTYNKPMYWESESKLPEKFKEYKKIHC